MDLLKQWPVRKEFEQDVVFGWDVYFTLKYRQATLQEFFDYYSKSPEEQRDEMVNLIQRQVPYTKFQKFLKKFWIDTAFDKYVNFENLIISVIDNRFRLYKSIYSEIDKRDNNKTQNKKGFFVSSLRQVCKDYSISPNELFNEYTLEQFFALLDWIRYSNNQTTKEWQSINKMAMIDKEAIKKRAEETKQAFNT